LAKVKDKNASGAGAECGLCVVRVAVAGGSRFFCATIALLGKI
jgi:hypothetical protein